MWKLGIAEKERYLSIKRFKRIERKFFTETERDYADVVTVHGSMGQFVHIAVIDKEKRSRVWERAGYAKPIRRARFGRSLNKRFLKPSYHREFNLRYFKYENN